MFYKASDRFINMVIHRSEIEMSINKTELLFDSNNVVIVIDTNQIYDNYHLNSPRFQFMLNAIEKLGFKMAIPEVVVEEVVSKYNEKLAKTLNDYNGHARDLKRLVTLDKIEELKDFNIVKHVRVYKNYLLRLIRRYGVVLPYPEVSHSFFAKKAVQKKRPFNSNGTGYRDALIWETIKNISNKDGKTVVFISNNSADFSKGKGNESRILHDDLTFELNNKDSVLYYTNIDAFNEEFISSHMEKAGDLDDKFGFHIEKWLNANVFPLLKENEDWGSLSTGLPPDVCRYYLLKAERTKKPVIIEAYNTDDNRLYMKVRTLVSLELSVNVDYKDFEYHFEVRDWLGFGIEPFDYLSVSHHDSIELVFDMIINEETGNIESSELVRIESDYGYIDY
jgi:hypothetical protein